MENSSRTAQQVFEAEFLSLRAKVLELAAGLDRIDRGGRSPVVDANFDSLRSAIESLLRSSPDRAEQVQLLFSRAYEDDWRQSMDI